MAKSSAKTPEEYIAELDEPRRSELQTLFNLVRDAAPELQPWMVAGMIGFGKYRYKGKSGREGEWYRLAISNNKSTLMFSSCGMAGDGNTTLAEIYADRLPKAKIGRSCINFRKLADVDLGVLRELAKRTAESDF